MPGEKELLLLQASRGSDRKKKKKKKRQNPTASITPPENTDKPQVVSVPPETLIPGSLLPPVSSGQSRVQLPKFRATASKDGGRLTGSGRRSKRRSKDSPALPAAAGKTSGGGAPSQGCVTDPNPNARARESLRWEGELEDPQAEEKRLELYRSNRRLRYISQREALFKESQYAL